MEQVVCVCVVVFSCVCSDLRLSTTLLLPSVTLVSVMSSSSSMGWYLQKHQSIDCLALHRTTKLDKKLLFLYLTRNLLTLAVLGTLGDDQETSMLSEPTSLKRRSEGAGTAGARRDQYSVTSLFPTVCCCSNRMTEMEIMLRVKSEVKPAMTEGDVVNLCPCFCV